MTKFIISINFTTNFLKFALQLLPSTTLLKKLIPALPNSKFNPKQSGHSSAPFLLPSLEQIIITLIQYLDPIFGRHLSNKAASNNFQESRKWHSLSNLKSQVESVSTGPLKTTTSKTVCFYADFQYQLVIMVRFYCEYRRARGNSRTQAAENSTNRERDGNPLGDAHTLV